MALRLSLRQMSVLHAIVRGGSAQAAAATLHISQPAVSKLISSMEAELGYTLFNRAGRGLEPTPQAISLIPYIERVLGEIDRLQQHALGQREGAAGTVTIAGNHTLLFSIAGPAITGFRQRYPDVIVDLRILPAPQIVTAVLEHKADIGLTYGPFFDKHLQSEQIGKWSVVCVFPKEHFLSRHEIIHPSILAGLPLLTYGEDSPIGLAIRQLFGNMGLVFSPTTVLGNTPSILQLVDAGLGIGLIDNFDAFATQFRDVHFRTLSPGVEISAILLRSQQSQNSQAIIDLVKSISGASDRL